MREQPVEPAPDPYGEFICPRCGSGLWGTSHCTGDKSEWIGHCHGDGCRFTWHRATQDESVGLTKVPEIAPIEVLVPRPEPSMSMFANKQDYETARAGTGVQPPAGEDVYHLRAYGDVSKEQLDYYSVHGTLDGFGETQRSLQPGRPDEKEGLQGPAIEDRARLLDALETIDIIWRHYVKPHTSDWRETEKAIKTIRAALGVEPDAAIRERT